MSVFIIVENLPVIEGGADETHECVLVSLGYFTDENAAEAKSIELTNRHLQRIGKREITFNDETRFGYVALELAPVKIELAVP